MCFDLSWNTGFFVIFMQLWLSHRIAVALISKSNRLVNNFQSHIASQLAEHAAMYSTSAVMRAILDCFLLCHEIMVDPKLKQHLEVFFSICNASCPICISISTQCEVMISIIAETIIHCTFKVPHHMFCSH
jgi:hypothetical protein